MNLTKSAFLVLWTTVRIFTKLSAPCFMNYGASIYSAPCFMKGVYIYKNQMHPFLWIIMRIFTKISAPCFICLMDYNAYIYKNQCTLFMDYGAYIYKNQCTQFYGLRCVYLQKSVRPVLWIMVCIFTKVSAPFFMDYVAYIYKNHCTVFYGLW